MCTGQGPGGGRGRRGGRRGGRGARENGNFSHEDVGSERKEDYTLKVDTDMTKADYVRKRTQMQHVPQSSHNAPVTGGQGATLALPSPLTDPLNPSSKQDLKRAKTDVATDDLQKSGDLGKIVSTLAGSFEECRRAQCISFVGTVVVRVKVRQSVNFAISRGNLPLPCCASLKLKLKVLG